MTQVSTNATGKPDHQDSTDHSENTPTSVPPARLLITGMLVVAGASLALATRAPLTVTVLGLIVSGSCTTSWRSATWRAGSNLCSLGDF